MKTFIMTFALFCSCVLRLAAQNDYLVTTSPAQDTFLGEEEQFISTNFPMQLLCKWTAGMKFMFIPSSRDMFLPLLSSYEDDKEVDSSLLKHKILTFIGTEEKSQEITNGTYNTTRFIFEYEGKKYYHEIKNIRLDELCDKFPRSCINGLVYLQDVDTAKELLIGRKVYIQSGYVRIDDANNYTGYKELSIPVNTEATITAIGVGNQVCPVKIIFTDSQNRSFYLELAISRTNSGMDVSNFQADKKMKYFSNAISFTDKKLGSLESLKNKYVGLTVYPKKTMPAQKDVSLENKQAVARIHLPRYTSLTIKEVQTLNKGTLVKLFLEDKSGSIYEIDTDLKYDIIVKNSNYIEDLFGMGDIQQKYPGITEERWKIISRGELEEGMSTDECRLSIGNPVEIQLKKDSRLETWFYNGRTLDFENGTLQRFK